MNPYIAGGVGMNKKPVVNIGVQRFDKLRKQGSFYIDKTDFIREWWDYADEDWFGGDADHASAPFWKDTEHEYARMFLF